MKQMESVMANLVRIVTNSMGPMCSFYQTCLNGQLLDQTDVYACIQVGQTEIELCAGSSQQQVVAIEMASIEALKVIVEQAESLDKPFDIQQYGSGKQAFSAQLKDPDGNLVQLSYYQFHISR